ncbi:MAG: hypothetical protein WCJ64_22510 [Rhodospirillaceae bacterium]
MKEITHAVGSLPTGVNPMNVLYGPFAKRSGVSPGVYASWLQHRSEDMRIGMETAMRLSGCQDIREAATIYSTWVSDSARRLQDEVLGAASGRWALGA